MESIYNLVPKPQVEIVKTEIYRSKYDPNAYVTYSTFGSHGTHATVWKGINEANNKVRDSNSIDFWYRCLDEQLIFFCQLFLLCFFIMFSFYF